MTYALDFGWLGQALEPILRGAIETIFLTAVTGVLGTLFSIFGAAAARGGSVALRGAIDSYVELIRNTPFLVQLFFIFFGLPSLGLRLDATVAAILAMTINLSAYGTEIVGAGLDAVSRGQREAGQALGLRPRLVFFKIVLPQALRVIFPALTSQIVIMMLESAVVSQIAVRDLTYEADMLQARTFRAFETYLVVTVVYLAMSIVLRRVMVASGRKLLAGGVS
ncbi:MAG: amino acid ABC transporter permease [Hyphomicrobiales bacterium]|nr:amino acid ABC transporter permease [Hyphomicrobiales bacterium]